jgi:hypothetical protein
MQQFQVPQFINITPKIVGPLTIKQFLILAAAGIPLFILFFVFKLWLWLIIAVFLASGAAALAFAKVNGQPLSKIAIAALHYFWQPRLYLWKRIEKRGVPAIAGIEKLEKPRGLALKNLFLKLTTTTHPIEKREKPSLLFVLPRIPLPKRRGRPKPPPFETIRKLSGERHAAKRIDYQ